MLITGKTTVERQLIQLLSVQHQITAIEFSLDDFYFPRAGLLDLKAQYPENTLLHGRGLPGTHDLSLLQHVLQLFKDGKYPVEIPIFEKEKYQGFGDRSTRCQIIHQPPHIVFFDGWMLGFQSIRESPEVSVQTMVPKVILAEYGEGNIIQVNQLLQIYDFITDYLDYFIHLWHPNIEQVYPWRWEQERQLIATTGQGMNQDQVNQFITRYMPIYHICLPRMCHERLWGKRYPSRVHLLAEIDVNRQIRNITVLEPEG
jgi:D-glycerate 3-kinase